jgi:hypothetical protein
MRCNVHHVMDVGKIKELIPIVKVEGVPRNTAIKVETGETQGYYEVEINTKYDNQKIPTEEDI